jgi:hypothetical protein
MKLNLILAIVLALTSVAASAATTSRQFTQTKTVQLSRPTPPAPARRHVFDNCAPSRHSFFNNSGNHHSCSSTNNYIGYNNRPTYVYTPSSRPVVIPNNNYTPQPSLPVYTTPTYVPTYATPSYTPPPTTTTVYRPPTYTPPSYTPPSYTPPAVVRPGHGNNGVGNGVDSQPPGNPAPNDGDGTGPGNPGNRPSRIFSMKDGRLIPALNTVESEDVYVIKNEKGRIVTLQKKEVLAVKDIDINEETAIVEK